MILTIKERFLKYSFNDFSLFYFLACSIDIVSSVIVINGITIIETSYLFGLFLNNNMPVLFVIVYMIHKLLLWGIFYLSFLKIPNFTKYLIFAYSVIIMCTGLHNFGLLL